MSGLDMKAIMEAISTDFTKNVYRKTYPAISPKRPELSQEGRTVLITGGGTGIGLGIAKSFVQARAAKVIIVGRRQNVLQEAQQEIEAEAQKLGSPTKVVAKTCDVTSDADVAALWDSPEIAEEGVDVLVLNAAKFGTRKPILESDPAVIWSEYEANVKGPLVFASRFSSQKTKASSKKYLINVSTAAIHFFDPSQEPFAALNPSYTLTKNSGTMLMQLIAGLKPAAELQVLSYHPGMILTPASASMPKDIMDGVDFDDVSLPGDFAVWAASDQATFLHGRFVWAAWDVEELANGPVRQKIDNDFQYLKVSVIGLKMGRKWYP